MVRVLGRHVEFQGGLFRSGMVIGLGCALQAKELQETRRFPEYRPVSLGSHMSLAGRSVGAKEAPTE